MAFLRFCLVILGIGNFCIFNSRAEESKNYLSSGSGFGIGGGSIFLAEKTAQEIVEPQPTTSYCPTDSCNGFPNTCYKQHAEELAYISACNDALALYESLKACAGDCNKMTAYLGRLIGYGHAFDNCEQKFTCHYLEDNIKHAIKIYNEHCGHKYCTVAGSP